MEQASLETKRSLQEKLDIKVKLATAEDWKAYKDLRLLAINSEDAEMFGPKQIKKDKVKSDEDWQNDISDNNQFVVLSWKGKEAIGMGMARQRKEGIWFMNSGYVKSTFRGGIGKQIFATRLKEIIRRDGKKALVYIKINNEKSNSICKSFGFKTVGADKVWHLMESDLTDPEVIKKIDETLNAG